MIIGEIKCKFITKIYVFIFHGRQCANKWPIEISSSTAFDIEKLLSSNKRQLSYAMTSKSLSISLLIIYSSQSFLGI